MRALLALSLVLLAACVSAQTPADSLRGNSAPLKAADLPMSFRAVSLGSGDPLGGLGIYGLAFASGGGGGGSDQERSSLLFSLMGATFVDPDEFAALLDGKRARIRGYALDLATMMRDSMNKEGGRGQTPAPVFTETWIEGGRVGQWSPRPGLTRDLILKTFNPANPRTGVAAETLSLSNVKQIALGMIMYSSDFDDHFPKADSTPRAKALVLPYVKSEEVWKSPSGGGYLYNTALSGVSQTAIEQPAETLLVWQEQPFPDGRRAVGFTDGHAKRVEGDEWNRLWVLELRRRQKAKMDAAATKAAAKATKATRKP